ncbi:hypothetical protein BC939DRAFT_472152 [Gamsiella multidivaricata]|uniref:uncharacterized protein n=1 Tax=Gamsiella multidivaricata TaxID=101098 RepID=UPI00221E48F4|nr:uncharacterized protein BC939DRAFT_472152 [Gamsiella multidivaricata]KAI7832535.1 hypothetical protein BC939DRAFT_472152 [Gamsiella multidivaricata]
MDYRARNGCYGATTSAITQLDHIRSVDQQMNVRHGGGIQVGDYSHFFLALRRREIKHTKESNIDITPAIDYFRQQGQNEGLSTLILTQKLFWLLSTCGSLRPNDILCIDLSNDKFHLDRITSILPILIPKKTRGGNRICEYTTIKSHDDPFLCPVKTLTEYLRRIQGHDIDVLHPKDPLILYRPLLRDAKDPGRYIGADRKLSLPKDVKLSKARAIGSTAAIKQGARVDSVVVHGN